MYCDTVYRFLLCRPGTKIERPLDIGPRKKQLCKPRDDLSASKKQIQHAQQHDRDELARFEHHPEGIAEVVQASAAGVWRCMSHMRDL